MQYRHEHLVRVWCSTYWQCNKVSRVKKCTQNIHMRPGKDANRAASERKPAQNAPKAAVQKLAADKRGDSPQNIWACQRSPR